MKKGSCIIAAIHLKYMLGKKKNLLIYFFTAVLGPHAVMVHGFLTVAAIPAVEGGFQSVWA